MISRSSSIQDNKVFYFLLKKVLYSCRTRLITAPGINLSGFETVLMHSPCRKLVFYREILWRYLIIDLVRGNFWNQQ